MIKMHDFLPFQKWMVDEMGVSAAENQVKIVANAYNKLPNLVEPYVLKTGLILKRYIKNNKLYDYESAFRYTKRME